MRQLREYDFWLGYQKNPVTQQQFPYPSNHSRRRFDYPPIQTLLGLSRVPPHEERKEGRVASLRTSVWEAKTWQTKNLFRVPKRHRTKVHSLPQDSKQWQWSISSFFRLSFYLIKPRPVFVRAPENLAIILWDGWVFCHTANLVGFPVSSQNFPSFFSTDQSSWPFWQHTAGAFRVSSPCAR